ncbi:MAG: serine/threonine protein kinase, partial [Lachnospiraceae bacterium]|nr:serine/threonine protein kinase [Lachnospiraceae bacterium]
MIRVGTVFAKRYEILEKIGSGGMADVFRARDLLTSGIVAIKALKASLSYRSDYVNRFEEEGRLASEFESENIVRVFDVGESGGTYYIVMEYVEGMTLKDYIRKKGMLSVRESLAIAAQVAVGLRTAHAHHLVHRDIKPQNLILSKDG